MNITWRKGRKLRQLTRPTSPIPTLLHRTNAGTARRDLARSKAVR